MTIDLDKLRKAAERSMTGPWSNHSGCYINPVDDAANRVVSRARFLSAANPATVLALIERVEKLEAALRRIAKGDGKLGSHGEWKRYSDIAFEALRDRESQ